MQNVKLVFFAALVLSHSTFPTMNSPQLLLSTICMSLFCSSNFVFNFRHHYPHKAPTLKLTPTACVYKPDGPNLCTVTTSYHLCGKEHRPVEQNQSMCLRSEVLLSHTDNQGRKVVEENKRKRKLCMCECICEQG